MWWWILKILGALVALAILAVLGLLAKEWWDNRESHKGWKGWMIKIWKRKGNSGKIIEALEHKRWGVRWAAVIALSDMQARDAVEPLIKTLEGDPMDLVREYAAGALGRIRGKGSIGPLIKALEDEDRHVRRAAASALSSVRGKSAIEPLINALEDEIESVRKRAAETLKEYKGVNVSEALKGWEAEEADRATMRAQDEAWEQERQVRRTSGKAACSRCRAALDWRLQKIVLRPPDFGGVCKECSDSFCKEHTDSGKCPFCGGQLWTSDDDDFVIIST